MTSNLKNQRAPIKPTLRKNNIKLKFFFITNFKISLKQNKSRHHFCKNFFLAIYFLIYYLNNKLSLSDKKQKQVTAQTILYSPKPQGLFFFTNMPIITQTTPTHLTFFNTRGSFFTKKYLFFNKLECNRFLKKANSSFFKINFLIFTKFFNHFVILRAPFRDKISKNILQNQRFFVYLNIQIPKKKFFLIYNKFFFYNFLINFQKIILFKSNILFLHSQRIKIFFQFPGIL